MKRKKIMTLILATMVIGTSVIGFAATKKSSKTKKTNTIKKVKVSKKSDIEIRDTFICNNETITVEYNGDTAKLKNKNGTHNLTIAPSGSGSLYRNSKGISIHMKGNNATYTSSSKSNDISCNKGNTVIQNKNDKKIITFKDGDKQFKVEYISEDSVTVTDFQGNKHTLKIAPSGSGELYTNKEGITLHVKGNEGVFTLAGIDYFISK